MKTRRIFLLLWLAVPMFAAEPAIDFLAVLAGGEGTSVSLEDKSSGQKRWVKIGQEFDGFVVSAYDSGAETLTLVKGDQSLRLRLKSAKVVAGAAEPPPETRRAILNWLRQLGAAADQYYLENGKSQATFDDLVGPTKYVKSVVPVDGEDYRRIVFRQGQPIAVTTSGGFTISYNP